MGFCPGCKNEYEGHVLTCPDCELSLTDTLVPEPESSAGTDPFAPAKIHAESAEVGNFLVSALTQMEFPVRVIDDAESTYLEVPHSLLPKALARLESIPELVLEDRDGKAWFRRYDPQNDAEVRNHEILEWPARQVEESGEQALTTLKDLLVRGSRTVQAAAVQKFCSLGSQAAADHVLPELLKNVERGNSLTVGEWMGVIRKHFELETFGFADEGVAMLRRFLGHEQREVRESSLWVIGEFRLKEFFPELISLLHDQDVAEAADEALISISGEDLGFDAGMAGGDLDRVVAGRYAWWQENQ